MKNTVFTPVEGTVIPLEQVPDEPFSQKMMGEGLAIMPSQGKVFAPFDGKVEVIADSKHALGLLSTDGLELLIHVGLETVELDGKYYTVHTEEDASFKKGDLLLEFDIDGLKKEGYNVVTPITVTNMDSYSNITLCVNTDEGIVLSVGQELFTLEY